MKQFIGVLIWLLVVIGFVTASTPWTVSESVPVDVMHIAGAHADDGSGSGLRYIDPGMPMVALTFDDGPGVSTAKILSLLDEYDARATFCVVGSFIDANTDLIAGIAEQGSEIASHTWKHESLLTKTNDDIINDLWDVASAIYDITGTTPRFVRPPYGEYDERVAGVYKEIGASILMWSLDTMDWDAKDADEIYSRIMDEVTDGAIIIAHDSKEFTGEAMERVIPELIEQGYQLVTVSELLESSKGEVIPGVAYTKK